MPYYWPGIVSYFSGYHFQLGRGLVASIEPCLVYREGKSKIGWKAKWTKVCFHVNYMGWAGVS